jgi:hypothetical protein
VLAEYKRNPDNMYLLKLAVGGLTNCLPNINSDGASSMGFHLSPANLRFDEYSGDWGVGFFAAMRHASSFLVNDPLLGQLCFLCDVDASEPDDTKAVVIRPRDPVRRRIFIASLGLDIISETARIDSIAVAPVHHQVVVTFESLTSQPLVSTIRMRVEQPAVVSGKRKLLTVQPSTPAPMKRNAWQFQPTSSTTPLVVTLEIS